jgi:hypothetical protein
MKNHGKDATKKAERCTLAEIYFHTGIFTNKKKPRLILKRQGI